MLVKHARTFNLAISRCFTSGSSSTMKFLPKQKYVASCSNGYKVSNLFGPSYNFSGFANSQRLFSNSDSISFNVQNEDDFDARVLKEKLPVIVDFHADWCGPCKLLGPRLEKEVSSQEGKVKLAKLDIDDEELNDIVMKFKISAVPTVMTFKNGKAVDNFKGNVSDGELKSFVKRAVDS